MALQTSATLFQCRQEISAAELPAIDIETLLSRCMNKRAFALSLLGELEAIGMQQIDTMLLHAAADDPLAVAETAHALKGAAAIVGAELLRQTAEEVEATGRKGELATLEGLVSQLRSEMARCLTFIADFRNTGH